MSTKLTVIYSPKQLLFLGLDLEHTFDWVDSKKCTTNNNGISLKHKQWWLRTKKALRVKYVPMTIAPRSL